MLTSSRPSAPQLNQRPVRGPLAVTGTRARYDRPHVDDHRKPFFGYETALMALSAHQLRRHGY